MGVRVEIHQAGIDALLLSPPIRRAVLKVAEAVQGEAVRLTAAELVDTGLMAASWRITDVSGPRRITYRVHNKARSPDGDANYPYFHEFGYRHWPSGRHVPARRVLQRAAAIRFL